MNFKGKNVLVTGAAGFIGSNLTLELVDLGANVIGFDNLFNGRIENLEEILENRSFKFIKGDVRDFNYLLEVVEDIDIIYHIAAFTSVPQSVLMPESCNDVNVNGTLNVDISGHSVVNYIGDPEMGNIDVDWDSELNKK